MASRPWDFFHLDPVHIVVARSFARWYDQFRNPAIGATRLIAPEGPTVKGGIPGTMRRPAWRGMEDGVMHAADITMKANTLESQAGIWMLALFLLGLAAMAWLTVREASLYETKTAIKNLRRGRGRKPVFPAKERLPALSRLNLFLRGVIRGTDIMEPFQDVLGDGREAYELRLRREIDKLVGKQVYHGQKEQLKPPTRPTSD
jgi:hypothetical protein